MKNFNSLLNNRGSTILENIVAFTILSGVIILLISVTGKIISRSNSERVLQATNLAQSEMEQLFFTKAFSDTTYQVDRWKIDRTIKFEGDKANIGVKVYYKDERFPIVELNSVRICEQNADLQ